MTTPTAVHVPPASTAPARRTGAFAAALRLARVELRLLLREPGALVALVGFPGLTVLVIAGSFGSMPDPEFGGVAPTEHYVVGYVAIVLASLGLITMPVFLTSMREQGTLRRYRASGVDPRSIVGSYLIVGTVLAAVGCAAVLAMGGAVYGIPSPERPVAVGLWWLAGVACFLAIGAAIGTALSSSRAAMAVGNLVFVPMFLLGGGGPPRQVMTSTMAAISDVLPLTHLTGGMRHAWLGRTDDPHQLWYPILVAAIALAVAARSLRRQVD